MADIVKKFGDVKRTRYSFESKNGKVIRHEKEIVLKNCYILIKANGDSFVGTADEFKALGIAIPTEPKVETSTAKSAVESPKV
jgi:hypothetical protein